MANLCSCGKPLVTFGRGRFSITPPVCPECLDRRAAEERAWEARQRVRQLIGLSRLTKNDFRWRDPRAVTAQAVPGVMRALAWQYGAEGLYLWGPVGCGKTVAVKHLLFAAMERGYGAAFVEVPELLVGLRSPFGSTVYRASHEAADRAKGCALVALDDLGAEQPSERSREVLFAIINHRLSRGLPTLYTSNLAPSDLYERLNDGPGRLVDRIVGSSLVIKVEGESFRRKAARERLRMAS